MEGLVEDEAGGSARPFVLDLDAAGAWRLELPDRTETSDGVRVHIQPRAGAPSWLGLGEALRRQAELELGLGSWQGPESRWQMRTGGRGGQELMRGWSSPRAILGEGPGGAHRIDLDAGSSVLRFGQDMGGIARLESITRRSPPERWTGWRAGPAAADELAPLDPPADTAASPPAAIRPPAVVPIEISPQGYLLVRPLLDGIDVGPFLFDTAASASCLDRAAATRLDWPDLGEIPVQGVGGKGSGRWRRSGLVELGALRRQGRPWIELDLAGLQAFRQTVLGGLIGADWLAGQVVVVDHGRKRIVFHDRRSPVHVDWPWQPLLVEGGAPCVELRCAPSGSGWFRLDTGSNDTVTLQSAEHRRALYPQRATFLELDRMRLGGIGGAAAARRGELPWIELGNRRVTGVPASFVTDTGGPLTSPFLLGTLGTGLLRLQPFAIDMDGQRIAFLAPATLGAAGVAGEGAGS